MARSTLTSISAKALALVIKIYIIFTMIILVMTFITVVATLSLLFLIATPKHIYYHHPAKLESGIML